MNNESRPRAVFSTEDFRLVREALAHYLKTVQNGPDSARCASLYHRLGRVDGAPPASPSAG